MPHTTEFLIDNDTGDEFAVHIEPECFVVQMKQGECLTVRNIYTITPVTLRMGKDHRGRTVVSLWPGDGDVVVEKDGVNVMGA